MTQHRWRIRIGHSALTALVLSLVFALVAAPGHPAAHATTALPGHALAQPRIVPAQPLAAPQDWPVFHGDAARDGVRPNDTHFSRANAASLVPVTTGGFTSTGAAMGSPVVYKGTLYYSIDVPITNTHGMTISTSTVLAVDAYSGATLWSRRIPPCGNSAGHSYIYGSPAVTTGMVNGVATTEVYVPFGAGYNHVTHQQIPGCIFDFDGQSGQMIWVYPLRTGGIMSSPAIMPTNQGPLVVVGDATMHVRAFPVAYTGPMSGTPTQAWAYDTNSDPPPPNDPTLCGSGGCGDSIWSSPAEAPVLVGGQVHHFVYFGVGASPTHQVGRLDALDMDQVISGTPALAWTFWDPHPVPDNDFGTVAVLTDGSGHGQRVYAGTNSGHLYAADATTGAVAFDFYVPDHNNGDQMMVHSTPALVHTPTATEVVFGSGCTPSQVEGCTGPQTGYVWAIDALSTDPSGTLLWQTADYGGDIVSSPVAANNGSSAVLFVDGPWYHGLAARGLLLALDPDTGAQLAAYPVFGQQYGSISAPAIYGGRLYLTYGYTIYDNNGAGGGGLAAFRCATCK